MFNASKMKKVLSVALCTLGMAALLAGCGGDQAAKKDAPKALRVGSTIDFAPFEFQDENQKEYQGFDMDLIRAIGKEMGVEIEIQNMGFDALVPGIQSHNVDLVISGMTINDDRKQNALFSDPYYQSGLTIVVRDDENRINKFQDLEGKTVAVQIGTTSANEVHKLPNVTVKELNTPADCFMELKAGGADAVVNDKPVNDYYIVKTGATGVKTLPEKLTAEDYGIAMAKDNTDLQKKVNEALKKLKENGEYDKIYKKWFGEAK